METNNKLKGLNTIDKQKIINTIEVQKKADWSYYSEREFVENLVSQRFNYFIVIYSLFITAIATVKDVRSLIIILSLGILILSFIGFTIYRTHIWLDIVFKILHNLQEKDHLFEIIRTEQKSLKWIKRDHGSVNKLMGIYIPLFCLLTLIIGLILVLTGCLKPMNS
jgi:disulfide bond formation protein DsbB